MMKSRHHLRRRGVVLGLALALGACSGGSDSETTTESDADFAADGSSDASGDVADAVGDGPLGVPMSAGLLGPGFEGLYVSPAVGVEILSESPPSVALVGVPCDQLVLQLVSSDWELVDRLPSSPTLIAGGIEPLVLLRDGDRLALLKYSGEADCTARLTSGERFDLTFSLPSGDASGPGWATTTRCSKVDGGGIDVSVELLTESGEAGSVSVRIFGSQVQFDGGILGRSPGGFYSELGRLYGDQLAQPAGEMLQVEEGVGTVQVESESRGVVEVSGPGTGFDGSGGQVVLAFPYSCSTFDDKTLANPLED